jgi:hypothetical protein
MNGWTKNSRFWKVTPWVVVLSALLSIYFDDPTTFIAITAPWITVAGGKSMLSTHHGRTSPYIPTNPLLTETSYSEILTDQNLVPGGRPGEDDDLGI